MGLYTQKDQARLVPEKSRPGVSKEPYRTPWRRDYARLIHSPAFRRLQGKTQLFPGAESDFFRNRLTHSIEVAQIAKSIANRINYDVRPFDRKANHIDTDLVEFAALAHDLGHPPFGHNGEAALDSCLKGHGGFEGNAQTLRILSRTEKRRTRDWPNAVSTDGSDLRVGLNLTYRTLASILKYDNEIQDRDETASLEKGYYRFEKDIVKKIKEHVTGKKDYTDPFKTIECAIMDIADDIAYSTYDLEDALKARFISPTDMLAFTRDTKLIRRIAIKVWSKVNDRHISFDEEHIPPELEKQIESTIYDLTVILINMVGKIFIFSNPLENQSPEVRDSRKIIESVGINTPVGEALHVATINAASRNLQDNGYLRTEFTSELVGEFIRGVSVEVNEDLPKLSRIYLEPATSMKVEFLKRFTYESHIMSSRLKVTEYRGSEIIKTIFDALKEKNGHFLLPDDARHLYLSFTNRTDQLRVVCDFIAGMTDNYALEFYGRLTSENPQTIFKPL